MQNKPTKIATLVALCCAYPMAFAEEQAVEKSVKLDEVVISTVETSDSLVNTHVDRETAFLKQAKDVKSLFDGKMDVNVSQLNGARSGGEGVNIRGLQANRVTSTVDGIPLPEAQEAKHFISYGSEFGRTDYVEVTAYVVRTCNMQDRQAAYRAV